MIAKVNIFAILGLLIVLLMGCATPHINQVKDKWGPPAKVEHLKETDVYYWFFYRGQVRPGITKFDSGRVTAGWMVYEITADKNGKILSKRKYWKQPEIK